MKTLYSFVVLLLVLGGLLETERAQGSDESVADILSAFRTMREVSTDGLRVPAVLEVPIDEGSVSADMAVLEVSSQSLQPTWTHVKTVKPLVVVKAFSSVAPQEAALLTDGNQNAFVSYDLPESGEGNAEIRLVADRPITTTSLFLGLDKHVALPRTIEIRAKQAGEEKIVLASSLMREQTVYFPKTTAQEWVIRFVYVQPLRIGEISLSQEGAASSEKSVRFLARPGQAYRVYSDPDRAVTISTTETGDLKSDAGVIVRRGDAVPNPLYRQADVDSDGVTDAIDNCVRLANTDQQDKDGNGLGDACEDFDKDGVMNSVDNCPEYPNRAQTDIDGDKKGDVCDNEESRLTEKNPWLPWVSMGLAAVVIGMLFLFSVRRINVQ